MCSYIPQTATMITFQQLVIYNESNRDSFAPFTLRGRLQHPELSRAPIIVIWLLHLVDTAEASVSCATVLLGYWRLLPARCWNVPHVTRNPWQQFRLWGLSDFHESAATPITQLDPSWFLFMGTMLRNTCSITNHTQLTHWERTLQMESGKLTAWYCNATSRCAWWRMVVIASTWCDINFFSMQLGMCPISIITFCLYVGDL